MNKKTISCRRAYISPSTSYLQMDMEGVIAQSVPGLYLNGMDEVNAMYDDDFDD